MEIKTRETSAEAFKAIAKSGRLNGLRLELYTYIFEYGPISAGRLFEIIGRDRHANLSQRFSELQRRGMIAITGSEIVETTGRKGVTYDITDRVIPLDMPKKPSRQQLMGAIRDAVNLIDESGMVLLEKRYLDFISDWRDI